MTSSPHHRAGVKAILSDLTNIEALSIAYYDEKPDVNIASQIVVFGTSGHRGSSIDRSFNEDHVIAIAQAIVDVRRKLNITGSCFIGKDTHFLSGLALKTVLEVFAANQIITFIADNDGYTPTPVISHAIINHNSKVNRLADGIVLTPSHNPPGDGGIKYNSPYGGPAAMAVTKAIEIRSNRLLKNRLRDVKRMPYSAALRSGYIHKVTYEKLYIDQLSAVIDMNSIAEANLNIGVDPLGGASLTYWSMIAEKYKLNINIVNDVIDPTFKFMHLDQDNTIRMDCSSQFAMHGLITLKDNFDLGFANDPDADRHGVVTSSGLMNANAYLVTVADYLLNHRPNWKSNVAIGKTLVTTAMLDKLAVAKGYDCYEYPVGFKWYEEGLFGGQLGFACEESAGGSFLRRDGRVWTTDKDGIILCLLAAEMLAKNSKDPASRYRELTEQFGCYYYGRVQIKASWAEKEKLAKLDGSYLTSDIFAGDRIKRVLTAAPANNAPIGGLKVVTENGWSVVRSSGTENAFKIYAESFSSNVHLKELHKAAKALVSLAVD